jgi:hypothetical protein
MFGFRHNVPAMFLQCSRDMEHFSLMPVSVAAWREMLFLAYQIVQFYI